MSETIKELTPQQIAAMDEHLKMGIEIGMSTHIEFDQPKIKGILKDVYAEGGLTLPAQIYFEDSPVAGMKRVQQLTGESGWVSPHFWGSFDVNWLQFYHYWYVECGLEEAGKLQPLYKLSMNAGVCWFYDEAVVVTARPTAIRTTSKTAKDVQLKLTTGDTLPLQVLHSTEQAAVEYADGTKYYFLNGVNVPAWLIEEPYDINKVMDIKNTEVRTEALKLGGPDVLEKHCDKKSIEQTEIATGGQYELYEITINDNRRVYLKGYCPSKGDEFNEAVPPTVGSVAEALHWRESKILWDPSKGYQPPLVRT